MLSDSSLDDFLHISPRLDAEGGVHRQIQTPFVLPRSRRRLTLEVVPLGEKNVLVHDAGLTAEGVDDRDALLATDAFKAFRRQWIEDGVSFDEEGRLFIVCTRGSSEVDPDMARLIEAALAFQTILMTEEAR